MGLLDVLNGMQNGPGGQQGGNTSSGGMSPITMAILGLLAYKAVKGFGGQQQPNPSVPGGAAQPGAFPNIGGGLGGLLQGGLGSLLAGGAAGGILSGGLGDLLKQFQQNGLGDVAKSWVGTGPNMAISPDQMEKALDSDQIKALMAHTGMSKDALLAALSQHLPGAVNHLTPNGNLPSAQEMQRAV